MSATLAPGFRAALARRAAPWRAGVRVETVTRHGARRGGRGLSARAPGPLSMGTPLTAKRGEALRIWWLPSGGQSGRAGAPAPRGPEEKGGPANPV
jgi:hypothetical protein